MSKLQFLLSLIFFVIVAYFCYEIINSFVTALKTSEKEVVVAVLGGMFTVLGAISAVIINQRQIKQREIDDSHRNKKIEIYNKFVNFVIKFLMAENEKNNIERIEEDELIEFMIQFKKDLLLYGSAKVIKAQIEFELISSSVKPDKHIFQAIDKIYKEMRSDIGLSNSNLNNYELVKLFITDKESVDEYIKACK